MYVCIAPHLVSSAVHSAVHAKGQCLPRAPLVTAKYLLPPREISKSCIFVCISCRCWLCHHLMHLHGFAAGVYVQATCAALRRLSGRVVLLCAVCQAALSSFAPFVRPRCPPLQVISFLNPRALACSWVLCYSEPQVLTSDAAM